MAATKRLLCGSLLCVVASCGPKGPPEPIPIGHLAPLSGPEHVASLHAQQGIELALEKAKEDGVGAGGRSFKVLEVDTRGESDQTKAETVRLLKVNQVAGLVAGPDAAGAAEVVREAQPYGTPVIVPGVMAPGVDSSTAIQLGVAGVHRGRALARHATQSLKATRAVILSGHGDPIAPAVVDGFTQAWSGGGRRLETLTYTDTDRADKVGQTARGKPDVVLVAGPPADVLFFREALKKEGLSAPLLHGGEDHGAEPFEATVRPGLDVYVATVFCVEKLTPRGQEFARRYQAKFGTPPDLDAVAAHDAAWLLFTAMQRTQSLAADRLRDELAGTESFEWLTGPVTFKDRQARRPLFLMRVTDGKPHLEETVGP